MTTNADVIVVGAGAMGSATAWWLARRGVEVVLLEQFAQGHTRGSSHGGSRIFRLAYADPFYVRLALEAMPMWRELEDDCGEELLELTGGVDHGLAGDVDGVADALEAAGRVVERLAPAEAEERWPGLRFEGTVVHSPDSGRILAERTVAALQRRASELGADVRFDTPVRTIDPTRKTVTTDEGEFQARRAVVVTAGAWLPRLGVHRGTFTVTREQYAHFAPAPADTTAWPSFIHYGEPWANYGLLTPGEGVKLGAHHAGSAAADPDGNGGVDPAARDRLVAYAERWLPGVDPTPRTEATCLYTNTPDSSFVIQRHNEHDLVVGSACSGHGFKFTPLIGRRLADLAVPTGFRG